MQVPHCREQRAAGDAGQVCLCDAAIRNCQTNKLIAKLTKKIHFKNIYYSEST